MEIIDYESLPKCIFLCLFSLPLMKRRDIKREKTLCDSSRDTYNQNYAKNCSLMDSNPCATRWRMKNLSRKKQGQKLSIRT